MGGIQKSNVEIIKENSNGLRGSIAEGLRKETDHFSHEDYQILKFHGIYQQDDRDLRQQLKKEGKDKKYIFMIRTKNPGGELSPEQWEVLNEISDQCADETLRITTRQDIQFHGVGKKNLKKAIQFLNSEQISTYGACGDGNRNTVACPVSDIRKESSFDGQKWAKLISERLSYKSKAYYDIWVDGERITTQDDEAETIYGKTYLPRKFKIGIGHPDDNCIDVHTHDIGIVPVLNGRLLGFNVMVGGGLGSTHRQVKTYPRLGDPIAFVEPERLLDTVTRIVEFQRDHGDRADRKHARLKYVLEEWGVQRVREELETRLGYRLTNPKPVKLNNIDHHLGWHEQNTRGLWYVGIFVENGRIKDTKENKMKKGLREIVCNFSPGIRLTPLQDVVLTNIPEGKIEELKSELKKYGIKTEKEYSPLRTSSMACPALPTCGLALAESERYLPSLIDELEKRGYGNEAIKMRMSGCPNSCSRPPVAEIGIIGTSPHKYNIYLGGNYEGTRLNKLFEEHVDDSILADRISSLIDLYNNMKNKDERFGDFCDRTGIETIKSMINEIGTIKISWSQR
jgi:sulfite reductase beta subunit-like hemoprotein